MTNIDRDIPYKHLLNCRVTLTTVRGAKYNGVISGFRPDKTCLNDVTILTRNGKYKATSKNKEIVRWFNNLSIASVEVADKVYLTL